MLTCSGYFPSYEDINLSYETHPIQPNLTSDSRTNSAGTDPGPLVAYHSEAVTHPSHSDPLDIRQNSEVREKLQQYQSDMVQAIPMAGHMRIDRRKLLSPRLSPLRIPEPVTPIELEESEAYVETREMIGARVRDSSVDDEWPLEPTFEEDG
ncbi:uncharacterized protein PAC_01111 [Phialocephala subalpina]|uniref:Uncharacterized protein n=1 Tax=Phialocephala subalpina TaxID=576137 RepID=A0A1L7WEN6_9HELO|nr:uncharacterized protein PAC_01111 [Phialocephala subalpina]